ncbi:MAG: hypothetical protein JXJ20_09400 [Anaerolineae bacterium]|nr:hypothetical protein [Anaerolineae bacterium]
MPTYREFSPSDWQRIERDWSAWWAGELDRPLIVLEAMEPVPGIDWDDFDQFVSRFPPGVPVDQVLDVFQAQIAATHVYADGFPTWWVNCGAGIVAAFLGAAAEHRTGTTWFHPPDVDSLSDLVLSYAADNPWWQHVRAITRQAVDRWGQQVVIGHTDLGGNLDILASMRGTQRLLLDLYDVPHEVERLTREITTLWLRYYDELYEIIQPAGRGIAGWSPCWFPNKGYMLQSDFCYMISPEMFERIVLPDLLTCCEALDYPFYHLDGQGEIRHLDMLLSIERLRGIQWIPGAGAPPSDQWPDLLRRIRDGGKLCQVYVTREGALNLLDELGGRGFLIAIEEDQALTPDEAEAFLKEIGW